MMPMSTNRVVIDVPGNTIRGPWEEPVRSTLPVPQTDPRLELSEQALVLASQNAYPIVARQKSRRDNLGLAAGGAIALVLGVATFASLSSSRHSSTAPAAASAAQAQPQAGLPMATSSVPGRPMGMPMPGNAAPVAAPQGQPMAGMNHMPGAMPMGGMPPASSPVLVFDGSSPQSPTVAAGPNTPRDASGAPTMLAMGAGAAGVMSDNSSAHASRLADPSGTVIQGTLIPAVLETAIDTDVPGFARAVVSQDVRSFDGSKVLIPRSSRLIGEYKSATQAGQRRAYLMWTRLVRPDGVSIALASPAADFTGQAGVGGQVNTHFFSRFGSAILLSILGGALTLATGGASTVVVSGGQSAAGAALQRDGNRGPTIKVRQGEPIRVFTARDLIFSSGEGAAG
jgi:type IV secretion system protein VirB10